MTRSPLPRTQVWLMAAVLLLCAGCGAASARAAALGGDRPLVITTISILGDFTRHIAGEHVTVESVVGIGGDPHVFEPRPSDAAKISEADLVLRNGLGLEHWLDTLIEASGRTGPVVTVTEGLQPAASADGKDPDPHMWMDPVLAGEYVDRIAEALADLDPAHRADFERNARSYRRLLDDLHDRTRARIDTVPVAQRRLVTTHDAFRYFGDRYGLEVVGTIWNVSTEREPSATEIAGLVDDVRAQGVVAVFVETTVNPDLMRQVARDAGVAVGRPLYGDSLGAPGSGADTYVRMMDENTRALVEGLGGEGQ
jgi:ABC-type Zn uptake system ZnuABC Zn-binding protein ZnuA